MKKLVWGATAFIGLAAGLWAQSDVRVITHPSLPRLEVLDRLSLDIAWHSKVKLENGRDGLFSLQLLPTKNGPELLVQTRAGTVLLFDAETGDLKWSTPLRGSVLAAAGYNSKSIFVARRDQAYMLNRKNGMHRIFSKDPEQPMRIMGFRLPAPPSAPLTADEDGLFVAMGQRITAYVHPDFERDLEERAKVEKIADAEARNEARLEYEKQKQAEREKERARLEATGNSPQPLELWSYYTTAAAVQQAPLATPERVCVVTSAGNFLSLDRLEEKLHFEFKTEGSVSAPMGQYGLTAYVGSDDYSLYALDVQSERIVWRFLAQAPIFRKPEVTDKDVFVTADRLGMSRLVRDTGQQVWRNPRAEQFLSAGPKFVYALDRKGQLLILDALRGTTLASWDARDWTLGISNEWTDRFYFAAQDGQILCLRQRELTTPVASRTLLILRKEKEEEKKPGAKKEDMEKKEEEKKEEKKEEKNEEKKAEKKEEKKNDEKKEEKQEDKADKKGAGARPRSGSTGELYVALAMTESPRPEMILERLLGERRGVGPAWSRPQHVGLTPRRSPQEVKTATARY